MFSESWERMAIAQAIVKQPALQELLPGQEAPPPTPEQVQATDFVFSRDEQNAVGSILSVWAAGMLVHDLLQDTCILGKEDEAEEREKRKSQFTPKE